ncbi:MAG: enoyl-CoA hydratase [Betaproteobacteria bacterium]|jgi:enoyl-CoA hydratase/carnithine racemase|nr:enoyl-CoA hydratase/isomerase family protein [Pseudomonadota bacterium]NBO03079.1 enoyl-CoA hydratase [Betaproteobacteria bacterium]NBO96272.1 enoyl-CoA hydratase [Betaproteobacteria bacterium]NBP35025.1 enoyl-CoA hydratase [Betaproteobacteria bacterium]NBP38633.1 enoyl-CoA hydratase [Betaproteobacteria bacterium]
MSGTVFSRQHASVRHLVISNLAKRNAMSRDMWQSLADQIAQADADPSVRVIVLEGDGDQAFVSGADISTFEAQRSDPEDQRRFSAAVEAAYGAPGKASKPVIAKIRGICFGGGLGLAAACDLRVAADDARFRMPAARLGLGYGTQGIARFISVVGVANTLDMFMTARVFSAKDALGMGFVRDLVPTGQLDQHVAVLADSIAENAPLTIAALKRTVSALSSAQVEELATRPEIVEALARCAQSEDYREGAKAFMEKRTPNFQGR